MGDGRRQDTHPALASDPLAESAIEAFLAALGAVDPTPLVRRAVRQGLLDDWLGDLARPHQVHVLALGKAAPRMLWGLVEASVPFKGLGVAPRGLQVPLVDTFRWLAGDHPVPGDASFAAGREVLAWADALPEGAPVLVLLSGGSSSCVEAPLGMGEAQLRALHEAWLREDLPVEALNQRRAQASALKGGRLGQRILARTPRLRVWLLCDTDPDHPEAVGSGPFHVDGKVPHRVLAGSDDLVAAAGLRLATMGHSPYRYPRRIAGECRAEVESFVAAARALPPGSALVGAGEVHLALPAGAPPGGRCHHAALEAARVLEGGVFLAAASDGVDGASRATGAWVRHGDWGPAAKGALESHAAARHLQAHGRSFDVGPTGTNVNDLWVLLKP